MSNEAPKAFDPARAAQVSRRNLPHWRQDGVIYFVTFRLADSLPAPKLQVWRMEREQWLASHPLPHSDTQIKQYRALWDDRINDWLDAGHGSSVLREPAVQAIVEGALRFFDAQRYRLGEFVVMPNHVHALVMPIGSHELSNILHSWKSFTANQINRYLGRQGALWQDESFDHIVRDDEAFVSYIKYIRENGNNLSDGEYRAGHGSLET